MAGRHGRADGDGVVLDDPLSARHGARAISDARLKITLGTGLLIGAIAMGATLSRAPIAVVHANTARQSVIGASNQTLAACQRNEVLPRETSAIRLRIFAFLGSRVTVDVLAHRHVIAHGERGSGWTGGAVTVPVKPLSTARSGVDLCFSVFMHGGEYDGFVGESTTGALAAQSRNQPLGGRVRVEYMRPSQSTWWSLARAVTRRMGLGRGWPGTWSVPVVVVLMGCVVLLCSRLILRALR